MTKKHHPVAVETRPEWAKPLSSAEEKFVREYVVDLSGTNAVLRAGLSKGKRQSASSLGTRIKKRPEVAEAINTLLAERSGVTGTAIVGELGAIAFSRITDYLKIENGRLVLAVKSLDDLSDEAKAAISRLKERVNDDGSVSIDVELHDKNAALAQLGKATGVIKEKVEVDHNRVVDVDPLDSIMERLGQLRRAQDAMPEAEIQPLLERAKREDVKAGPIIDHEPLKH